MTKYHQADLYKTIDVLAKVMIKNEKNQVIMKQGKRLMKSTCIIADTEESIQLVLWQDHIEKVDCGKTYLFKGIKVRVFDDTKYLTTNESTIIEQKDDLRHINLSSEVIKDNIINGQCLAALIKKSTSCLVCNASIELDPDETNDTITCPSCQMRMLSSLLNDKLVCTLVIKNNSNGKKETYTCFNDTLQSFFTFH